MSDSIFVAYRRKDSSGWSGRLYDALTRSFPDMRVFRDVDSLQAGQRWSTQLEQEIEAASLFILVIGATWSSATELRDPQDVHRREIEHALARGRPVLPVCVGEATLPTATDLPISLRPVLEWHAAGLSDERWSEEYAVLESRINDLLQRNLVRLHVSFAGTRFHFNTPLHVWWDAEQVGSGNRRHGFDIHIKTRVGDHRLSIDQGGKLSKVLGFQTMTVPLRLDKAGAFRADLQLARGVGGLSVRLTRTD